MTVTITRKGDPMMQRRTVLAGAIGSVAAPLLGLPTHARAQLAGNAFVVSGFPPGGMGDMVARPLAEKLRGKYAESLLLDSRPAPAAASRPST